MESVGAAVRRMNIPAAALVSHCSWGWGHRIWTRTHVSPGGLSDTSDLPIFDGNERGAPCLRCAWMHYKLRHSEEPPKAHCAPPTEGSSRFADA